MEEDVLKAVRSVHEMIDREVAAGISADCIFLCGFSQGGKSLRCNFTSLNQFMLCITNFKGS